MYLIFPKSKKKWSWTDVTKKLVTALIGTKKMSFIHKEHAASLAQPVTLQLAARLSTALSFFAMFWEPILSSWVLMNSKFEENNL